MLNREGEGTDLRKEGKMRVYGRVERRARGRGERATGGEVERDKVSPGVGVRYG